MTTFVIHTDGYGGFESIKMWAQGANNLRELLVELFAGHDNEAREAFSKLSDQDFVNECLRINGDSCAYYTIFNMDRREMVFSSGGCIL